MTRASSSQPIAAPAVDVPALLRNVVLVGPSGAGKTALVESLLVAAGATAHPGRGEDGTVSDCDDVRRPRSTSLSLASLPFEGIKVNLLDTPGYADFVGDLRSGLRAADSALFVVSAADGVDAATRLLWEECAAVGMPRAIVITKLDSPRADFDEMVAICQRVLGDAAPGDHSGLTTGILPLYLPLARDDGSPGGVLSLLSGGVSDYSTGTRVERPADPEHLSATDNPRNALIEAILAESEDESLMDRYLAGEALEAQSLVADLETAVARGSLYPVLPVTPLWTSAVAAVGTVELLRLITEGLPSPVARELPAVTDIAGTPQTPPPATVDAPVLAEVITTTDDLYLGRRSLVRVFSGTLRPDSVVHVARHLPAARDDHHGGAGSPLTGSADHDVDERVGALFSLQGETQRRADACIAGDLCMVAELSRARTGDTISAKGHPLLLEPRVMPQPRFPVAVAAHSAAEDNELSQVLARLVAQDPSVCLEVDSDTGQLVLWCMGEAHLDLLLDRLRTRQGVALDVEPLRLGLRETFAAPATGQGRHVEQSGGHGQYAACDIEVEPLPAGSGFEFVERGVDGAVPRQFLASMEKGVRAQMQRGVLAGHPVIDIRVTLVDGKAHPVDSSDLALQAAGALALRDAAAGAAIRLLEPVDEVIVVVADEYVGPVLSDLSSRRGRILGTEPAGAGRTRVRAEAPQREIARYAVELRSLAHGTGSLQHSYVRHQPMPKSLTSQEGPVPA